MNKDALNAYLSNNNLDPSGVYGYYEFNTGFRNFLLNNYYSGDNYFLFSVTGLEVISGGSGYSNSSFPGTGNSGDIVSVYGEYRKIPFAIQTSAGVITNAYTNANIAGGNVDGNVGTDGKSGLYFETPTITISNTDGSGGVIAPILFENYVSGTRYDLHPMVGIEVGGSGSISGAVNPSSPLYGSGYFTGKHCLRYSTGFNDDNWSIFVDFQTPDSFAVGKSKILITSYDSWTLNSGFALTIDDSNHLNFEYRNLDSSVENIPTNILLQKNNLISLTKDSFDNSIIIGRHDLSQDEHQIEKYSVDYVPTRNLYFGGYKYNQYPNTGYTGFSGYINEILILNQTANSDQLIQLSNLFSITGYDAATTGSSISYYPIVTGVTTQLLATGTGITGYDLIQNETGFSPSGITGELSGSGVLVSYDAVNSGQIEEIVTIDEKFYIDEELRCKYGPKYISFETEISNTDIVEIYSFNTHNNNLSEDVNLNFSSTPGKLYFDSGVSGNFNLYNNGIKQVSGEDYDYSINRSIIDSNQYDSYSNSEEDNVFATSLPESNSIVSGFVFQPTNGVDYTYSNFASQFPTSNTGGYFLYLNGQKLTQGTSYDYKIVGNDLVINNAANNYESGKIDIATIRSGEARNYINTYGVVGSNFFSSGISDAQMDCGLIDEHVFLNGQRLKRNYDYFATSKQNLNIRNAEVPDLSTIIYNGETGFFNL